MANEVSTKKKSGLGRPGYSCRIRSSLHTGQLAYQERLHSTQMYKIKLPESCPMNESNSPGCRETLGSFFISLQTDAFRAHGLSRSLRSPLYLWLVLLRCFTPSLLLLVSPPSASFPAFDGLNRYDLVRPAVFLQFYLIIYFYQQKEERNLCSSLPIKQDISNNKM
ncbi:hypothetical protein [Planomicrobium sp. CPCC 101079]|uniref:hypothetical protein n=1 Tax=Planomicrobium sp. CPCC 101079 TaxID=2599618 RepID=UPI0011B77A88|nr:hypothetical protein [Planomicrobium sp. CPCC 101079]TWT00176.1 hypothetical protein FQV28_18850 [Planomicrobium sp. CPCC 101079]